MTLPPPNSFRWLAIVVGVSSLATIGVFWLLVHLLVRV